MLHPQTYPQPAPANTELPREEDARGGVAAALDSLDRVTHAIQLRLGNFAQSVFFVGDGLQRAIMDRFFDLWNPHTWAPANLLKDFSKVASQSVEASRLLATHNGRTRTVQEIANKLEVFVLVKNLVSILNIPQEHFVPLPELVVKAYQMEPFAALWAVEGLGHYYADAYWEIGGPPQGLLLESSVQVPDKSLLMLHAGMGLAFADRLLGTVTPESTADELRRVVEQFVELCDRNSRKGYRGAAIESLGLVTRDFYPEMTSSVNRQLVAAAPELTGFFWHGVGRALYFSRKYFLPVLTTVWNGIDVETGDEQARRNAIAGLAWAITLVNMRQPGIMEQVLQWHAERPDVAPGFMNGVSSSIVMRADTTPGEHFISDFYSHRPERDDDNIAALWKTCISEPSIAALKNDYPALTRRNSLDQIFQFHTRDTVETSTENLSWLH
jgi:hypothetical protein